MTKDEEHSFDEFQARVRTLIMKYRSLQEEMQELRASLAQSEKALSEAQADAAAAREDFERLKVARMMNITSADIQEARQRVDKLVRSVDRCIALLGA